MSAHESTQATEEDDFESSDNETMTPFEVGREPEPIASTSSFVQTSEYKRLAESLEIIEAKMCNGFALLTKIISQVRKEARGIRDEVRRYNHKVEKSYDTSIFLG